jgi:LuxR family quorum-sensing transcriptional regulator LasR
MEYLACLNLLKSGSEAELMRSVAEAVTSMGFERTVFIVFPRRHSLLDTAHTYSNCEPEWMRRYQEKEFINIDPTMGHCMNRTLPMIWDETHFVTPRQQLLYKDACSFGLHAGVTLPVHGDRGEVGMLTCASARTPRMTMQEIVTTLPHLVLLRDIAFASFSRFSVPPKPVDVPKLSRREAECMKLNAAGKTSWEIGEMLCITESCVNFHFNNIRRKFSVSHRHEAVIRAIEWGLIN